MKKGGRKKASHEIVFCEGSKRCLKLAHSHTSLVRCSAAYHSVWTLATGVLIGIVDLRTLLQSYTDAEPYVLGCLLLLLQRVGRCDGLHVSKTTDKCELKIQGRLKQKA